MIRPGTLADAEALGRLHVRSWQAAYADIFPDDFLAGLDPIARSQAFRTGIERGEVPLVAVEEGDVAGFCWSGKSRDNDWGEIYAIYVDPAYWGRGHGASLITEAEGVMRADGYEKALLWVLAENRQARRFYERMDWVLGRPIRLEEIGGVQVTEVRYEKNLRATI